MRFATDPRGFIVYVPDPQWEHAIVHEEIAGQWSIVERTIESPDKILTNPQNSDDFPHRVADERYVRFDAEIKQHIVVAARIAMPGEILKGIGVLTSGARVLITAHPSWKPQGTTIWPPTIIRGGGT